MKQEENKIEPMRHSCEHVLTMAMMRLWPGKIIAAMGPATEEGFYFDFDSEIKFSTDDFNKIEKEMAKIIKEDLPIIKNELTVSEARNFFSNNTYKGNVYKHEWIDEIESRKEKVSVYWMGKKGDDMPSTFVDICSGPHVESTSKIRAFKLLKIAGAYWHGDEKNKMLQRIYGTCFNTQEELDNYLHMLEEAEKRDHRKLGKDLDLFVFSEMVGKGLPTLTPKGTVIRRELEKFVIEEETKRGYKHVITPPLAKTELYKLSGHYPYYKDTMYPVMKVDDDELILRPMTCPHHFMFYKSHPHSYKELPYRIAEISPQFRYEKSGELSGLMRCRLFCLADAHIICTEIQAEDEIIKVLELIDYANKIFGLKKGEDYRYRLSLGDRSDNKKYYKDDKAWDKAEEVLRNVLVKTKAPFFEAQGEAAFYGPKIDVNIKKINGVEETAFTVQYDFVMPQRFDLKYIDNSGEDKQPIVIHRSSIGAFERTMAFLIERYAGSFPTWLAPIQAVILPISEKQNEYAQEIYKQMFEQGVRVEINSENESLGKKIRQAQLEKIPYMIIVGDKEMQNKEISLRDRSGKDFGSMKLEEFLKNVKKEIVERSI